MQKGDLVHVYYGIIKGYSVVGKIVGVSTNGIGMTYYRVLILMSNEPHMGIGHNAYFDEDELTKL